MAQDAFLQELRATFAVEAQEHVATMSTQLQVLQQGGQAPSGAIESMFRAAHSLKGAARTVELTEIEALCQSLEDLFAYWRKHGGSPGPVAQDRLHQAFDALATVLAGGSGALGQPSPVLAQQRQELRRLAMATAGPTGASLFAPARVPAAAVFPAAGTAFAAPPAAPVPDPEPRQDESMVRVAVAKLEAQLRLAEEMLGLKLASAQRMADWQAHAAQLPQWQQAHKRIEADQRELRARAQTDEALARTLEFIDWSAGFVETQAAQMATATRGARRAQDTAVKQIDDLLDNARTLFALPFASVSAPFAKLVRDLCRDQGKQAQLVQRGEQIELDKRILQEIKDPLLHLLRNAVDHGVEPPVQRQQRGKPASATLVLEVSRTEDHKVRIVLSDDGRGFDAAGLRQAAVKAGLLAQDDAARLDEPGAHALVFLSGLSTAAAVTPVSGRGLGLAIVREKVERLGGEVLVHSDAGAGTRFTLTLPARWTAFRGILVEASECRLLVPTAAVQRVARVGQADIRSVEGRRTVAIGGRTLALVELERVLDLPARPRRDAPLRQVVVMGHDEQAIAFAVDAVLDEREVLTKPLGHPLVRVRNIAAAAVLGSGELVPVLHVADLLRSARQLPRQAGTEPAPAQQRKVLVAEDSITSRLLLKSILETAGYHVTTAVDGIDAWAKLRSDAFDLLVSDVEMPRLHGFDLTSRVRADRQLAQLPVVLVTALQTPQDEERGWAAGANAYIAKGSFDQNQLLEVIARLA